MAPSISYVIGNHRTSFLNALEQPPALRPADRKLYVRPRCTPLDGGNDSSVGTKRAVSASDERTPRQRSDAKRIERELRREVEGEVRFDDGSRAAYAYDGSIYRQVPIGVVVPKSAADVEAA